MTKKHAFPVIASRGAFENGTAYTHDAYTSTQRSYEATRRLTPPDVPTPAPAPAPAEVSRACRQQILNKHICDCQVWTACTCLTPGNLGTCTRDAGSALYCHDAHGDRAFSWHAQSLHCVLQELMLDFRALLIADPAAAGLAVASLAAGARSLAPRLRPMLRMTPEAVCALQISLLSFRTQFIVAGPGLVPWQYDAAFLAGMTDYLGLNSGVGNLTIRNWAEVNLANFPVSCAAAASTLPSHETCPAMQLYRARAGAAQLLSQLHWQLG